MLCMQCGKENAPNARFCVNCGEQLIVNGNSTQVENIDVLYKRIVIFLEDQDWKSAQLYCERILDIEPENEKAYLGKLMAEFQVSKVEQLSEGNIPIDGSMFYQKIMRFGNEELKTKLESYNQIILNKIKESKRCEIYDNAVQKKNVARTIEEYKTVIDLFKPIMGYRDVDILVEECNTDLEILERKKKEFTKNIVLIVSIMVVALFFSFYVIVPNVKYKKALNYVDMGNYVEAYKLFMELSDYKDSSEQIKKIIDQDILVPLKASNINVGDTIKFGNYEQDGDEANGPEQIEWIVLNKKGSEVLLISNKCLVAKEYNEEVKTIAWKDSTLRVWLNDTFYDMAFLTEEKAVIVEKEVEYRLYDKVSLLTLDEVNAYFVRIEERRADAVYTNTKVGWWLREEGASRYVPIVSQMGEFGRIAGTTLDTMNCGVRPIIYVTLD